MRCQRAPSEKSCVGSCVSVENDVPRAGITALKIVSDARVCLIRSKISTIGESTSEVINDIIAKLEGFDAGTPGQIHKRTEGPM